MDKIKSVFTFMNESRINLYSYRFMCNTVHYVCNSQWVAIQRTKYISNINFVDFYKINKSYVFNTSNTKLPVLVFATTIVVLKKLFLILVHLNYSHLL